MYIYVYIYKPTSRRKQKSDFWGLHNLMMMSFIVFFFFFFFSPTIEIGKLGKHGSTRMLINCLNLGRTLVLLRERNRPVVSCR